MRALPWLAAPVLVLVVSRSLAQEAPAAPAKKGVLIAELEDRCRIEIDGELFTEYRFRGQPVPILYPVLGADGKAMTRHWPLKEGKDEAQDHPHHRSLWFSHGEVNGHDFWSNRGDDPRIEHEKILDLRSGAEEGLIKTANRWMVGKDEVVCRDVRTLRFRGSKEARYLDWEVTITATEGDLHFGDTKEGTMAIRLAPTLRLRGKVAEGKLRTSEGVTGAQAWGKRARWVDYWGPVDGEVVGVALFDHPKNYGHPCRWHARDYGLFAANPWGIGHFEGSSPGRGMRLKKGESVTLRYRFYFHRGEVAPANMDEEWKRFAATGATERPDKGKEPR